MGFDALFFARIDETEKAIKMKNKELQFVWEGSDAMGEPVI